MSSELAVKPSFDFYILILTGKDKGKKLRIANSRVTIGREPGNDIVLNDKGCSRQHARIEFSNQGITIQEITERNQLEVNGQKTKQSIIKNNSIFKIANTKLQLQVKAKKPKGSGVAANQIGAANSKSRKDSGKNSGGKPVFYIVVMVVAFLAYILFSTDAKKKSKEFDFKTDSKVKSNFEAYKKTLKNRREAITKSNKSKPAYKTAQAIYIQGSRDYKNGNYGRALESFQACLSIFPSHKLCSRYASLARQRADELANYNLTLAREYMAQNQYKSCKKVFADVMISVKDRQSRLYKEAKSGYRQCKLFLEERY